MKTQLTLLVINDVNQVFTMLSLLRTLVQPVPSWGQCDLFWPMNSEQKCHVISRPEYLIAGVRVPRDFSPLYGEPETFQTVAALSPGSLSEAHGEKSPGDLREINFVLF